MKTQKEVGVHGMREIHALCQGDVLILRAGKIYLHVVILRKLLVKVNGGTKRHCLLYVGSVVGADIGSAVSRIQNDDRFAVVHGLNRSGACRKQNSDYGESQCEQGRTQCSADAGRKRAESGCALAGRSCGFGEMLYYKSHPESS